MARKLKNGWLPDLPGHRDYSVDYERIVDLPSVIDLRASMPPVYDQQDSSSCTANAIAGAIEHQLITQKLEEFTPSRLFIYYNERALENSVTSDSGAQIRDGIKTVVSAGVCAEKEWPFDLTNLFTKPNDNCYVEAKKNIVESYTRLGQNLPTLKSALIKGYPIVCGITLYNSFESDDVAKSGIVPLPSKKEECLGGHAVLICGYNDANHSFIVRNSWGADWGMGGYFSLPYDYILNNDLASDFWVIKLVS